MNSTVVSRFLDQSKCTMFVLQTPLKTNDIGSKYTIQTKKVKSKSVSDLDFLDQTEWIF